MLAAHGVSLPHLADTQHLHPQQPSKGHMFAGACVDVIPQLQVLHSFASNDTKCSANITVVTQLDITQYACLEGRAAVSVKDFDPMPHAAACRLMALQSLCLVWKGWIAAAVLAPRHVKDSALASLATWHASMQQVGELHASTASANQFLSTHNIHHIVAQLGQG